MNFAEGALVAGSSATARVAAIQRASAPFMEFFTGRVWARRMASADPCDFVFGNPHEMPLPGMVEALRQACEPRSPDWFAYKVSEEAPRRAAAAALSDRVGVAFDPEDVLLTKGAAAALPIVLAALLAPGDEVIYVTPPWFFYAPMILAAGGVAVPVPCERDGFDLDIDAIAAAITPRTRAMIVNSPNNPTGRIYPVATLQRLAVALTTASERHGRPIHLISDEAYQRILFPGTTFVSPAASYPHSFLIYSYAKTLLNPGQRLGYIALPPQMPDRDTMRAALLACQTAGGQWWPDAVMQYALPALEDLCIDLDRLRSRKDTLLATLRAAGYQVHDPEGTFYLLPRSPIPDDTQFAELLADRDVYVLPGATVDLPGWFRISLTANDEMVCRSLDRFADAFTAAGGNAA